MLGGLGVPLRYLSLQLELEVWNAEQAWTRARNADENHDRELTSAVQSGNTMAL